MNKYKKKIFKINILVGVLSYSLIFKNNLILYIIVSSSIIEYKEIDKTKMALDIQLYIEIIKYDKISFNEHLFEIGDMLFRIIFTHNF